MNNVLLVTSPIVDAPHAVAYAMRKAKDTGAGLVALAVLDPELSRRVASTLTNVGFVGDKVSDSVLETLAREQRANAADHLKEIGEQARGAGLSFTALVEEGEPSEVCSRVIETHHVTSAVLVAEKRSWLTRFLSHAATVKLPALAGCEVKIMDD